MSDLEKKRSQWRAASLKYSKTKKGKLNAIKSARTSASKEREKDLARSKVRMAVFRGKIVKPEQCEANDSQCSGRIEAHHRDYRLPYEVNWLCVSHHSALHLDMKIKVAHV